MELRDCYKILNLRYGAPQEEVKNSYRNLAKKYHPDLNPTAEAKKKFIEINTAYERISNLPPDYFAKQAQQYRTSKEFQKRRNHHDEESRRRAMERARAKHEQMKKKQEEFKKSGIYDILLMFQYFFHYLLAVASVMLVLFPVIISIKSQTFYFPYYIFFWITGGSLCYYIITNRKTFFKVGEFYYSFPQLKDIALNYHYIGNTRCYYCKDQVANALPYKVHLLKVRDIVLDNKGPLQHYVGYKSKNVDVEMPRSRKALYVHFISTVIRLSSIVGFIIFLDISSVLWRFNIGLILGTLLSYAVSFSLKTKARNTYIFTYGFLAKIFVWLLVLSLFTSFDFAHLNIYGSEKTGVIVVLLFLLDPIFESFIKFLLKDKHYIPLTKQPPKVEELLNNKFQYYLEISGWSMLYPLTKWIFG